MTTGKKRLAALLAILLVATWPAAATGQAARRVLPPEYDLCRTALQGATTTGPYRVAQPQPDTICFAGNIDRGAMDALVAALRSVPEGSPLTLVAGSSGGSVTAALDASAEILRRRVTIITGPVCASSCANYLFLPAARRIIGPNPIVAFHGGMSGGLIERLRRGVRQAQRAPRQDPALTARREENLGISMGDQVRERNMLNAIGIDSRFFEFFERIPAGPGSQWRRDCPGRPNMDQIFVFSENALRSRGVAVELNLGPKSDVELQTLLKSMGQEGRMCFWR